ncbi:MAG: sensor histidine kinase, partial [Hyphomicrobium sp.]|nr:sensor histidine kinase [Hyphomicrobium sp.]
MKSIRLRLLLGAVLGITIALVIAGAILVSVFEGHIRQRYIKELDDHLLQLAAAVEVGPSGAVTLRHELSDPAFQRPLSGLYWQVADAGHIVLRSRSLWDEALAATSVQFAPGVLQESETKGPRAQALVRVERVVLAGAGSGRPLLLTVAGERGVIDEARRDITRIVSLSLAILAALLAAASWVQVGAGLAPLQRLRAQLNNLRQGKAARLEGHHPVELSGLVDDLNGLIAVQAQEVERARANASKLGHGLKTPLAILAAEARELREKGEVAAATAIEHEVETMNARVAQTLASVRAVGPRKAIGTRTVLEPFLQRLVDTMKRLPRGDRHQ